MSKNFETLIQRYRRLARLKKPAGMRISSRFGRNVSDTAETCVVRPSAEFCFATRSHHISRMIVPVSTSPTTSGDNRWPAAVKALPVHEFLASLANPETANEHAVRPGVLFNYLGVSSVDGMISLFLQKAGRPDKAG